MVETSQINNRPKSHTIVLPFTFLAGYMQFNKKGGGVKQFLAPGYSNNESQDIVKMRYNAAISTTTKRKIGQITI